MTDRITALRALERAVEAGRVGAGLNTVSVFGDNQTAMDAVDAFHGSLDAAKALHVAMLGDGAISTPGYYACVWLSGKASVWGVIGGTSHHAEIGGRPDHEASPARAWLLAIIRALIAQEGGE